MKFSVRINNDLPVEQTVAMARAAERAGFDQFWLSDDLFLRSAVVMLTACALATERIEIGTCIVNPYTIHPAEIAMIACTLDECSNGRFNLGLSSGAAEFLKWIGITPEKPVTAVRETLDAINRLTSGERAALDGPFLRWTGDAYLRFTPRRRIPIYVGALSPNMLRLIGSHADGGLPLLLPPEHYETVQPLIADGAREANRRLEDIDIAACIWCSLSDDRTAADDALRDKIAYYGHAMSPLIWERIGVTRADFDPIERAIMTDNDLQRARSLVTPLMMQIGVSGTAAEIVPRLRALAERGVRHLSFGPPLGPDPLRAVEQLGREVLPALRA